MTRKAICVYSEGQRYELVARCAGSFNAAAQRWGADFVPFTRPGRGNFWTQKIRHFMDVVTDYDRVLYIDGDMMIRADCPNVFDIVPEHKVGYVSALQDHRIPLIEGTVQGVPLVQGGFQLYSRHPSQYPFQKRLYQLFKRLRWNGMDQDIIQFMVSAVDAPVAWLPAMFDFILPPPYSSDWGDPHIAKEFWSKAPMLPRYIVHFAGNREGWPRKKRRIQKFEHQHTPGPAPVAPPDEDTGPVDE